MGNFYFISTRHPEQQQHLRCDCSNLLDSSTLLLTATRSLALDL
jgi:hypothetical protein